MQRPFQKQAWFWAVSVLVLAAFICSFPSVRIQYHKSRLDNAKARKNRLMAARPSAMDKIRLQVTGNPVSGQELDATIRSHEDALVSLGFLDRAKLPAQMVSACPETLETLTRLKDECPWYHATTVSGTNLVLTACPQMMDAWRKRVQELGW